MDLISLYCDKRVVCHSFLTISLESSKAGWPESSTCFGGFSSQTLLQGMTNGLDFPVMICNEEIRESIELSLVATPKMP